MSAAPTSVAGAQLKPDPDWLARRREPVFRPDLAVIDPHHHLWHVGERRYLAAEIAGDLNAGHRVLATVHAQCHSGYHTDGPEWLRPVGETEMMVQQAAEARGQIATRLCAGIIGSMDIAHHDHVEAVLDAHITAGAAAFRGLRLRTAWHADDRIRTLPTTEGLLSDHRLRQIARALGQRGLVLDVWVYQSQLPEVAALCRDLPDLTVVVNHAGGPIRIADYASDPAAAFADWHSGISAIAACPNAVMKFGGLGMRLNGFNYHLNPLPPASDDLVRDWLPWFEACLHSFTPQRMMFETNFPVDKAMFSYVTLWNAFKKLAAPLSEDEQSALLWRSAARIYSLSETDFPK